MSFRTANGTAVDRLLLVPTELLDRTGVLEDLHSHPAESRETTDGSRRTVFLAGLLLFGALVGGLTAALYVSDSPLLEAIELSVLVFGVPIILFLVAYFTNLLNRVPTK